MIGHHLDLDAVALLDLHDLGALAVEHVDRRLAAGAQRELGATATRGRLFEQPER